MDLGISGKKAAVAASSAGLGLGAAKALAQDGVQVALSGRDPERLAAAAAEISAASSGEVVTVEADLSRPDGGRAFVESAIAQLGPATGNLDAAQAILAFFRPFAAPTVIR